jgi:ribose transport system substrate-binding protein
MDRRTALACALAIGTAFGGAVAAQEAPLVGIVSISATEANNARYIQGATAAAEELGWEVSVIDAAGSADQANAGIQNFVQRGAIAVIDMVFPYSSIGAGLETAAQAGVPVVTWGGGLGGTVAATNGSGGPMAEPVIQEMLEAMPEGGSILALTYRTGEVCRNRETVLDEVLAGREDIQGRDDVLVYGINGNAQALENIRNGHMDATAWQDSYTEGYEMVKLLEEIIAAGDAWGPKAVEVPAVLVTAENIEDFIAQHPEALGQ